MTGNCVDCLTNIFDLGSVKVGNLNVEVRAIILQILATYNPLWKTAKSWGCVPNHMRLLETAMLEAWFALEPVYVSC